MSLLDRTQPPVSGEIRQFDFPEVQTGALPNGLDLKICVLPRLPIVSVNLFLRAGEGSLVEGRAGTAVLTGDALEGGTLKRSGSSLAEALEGIGARLGVSTGWEGTSISVSVLADRLPEAFALLAEVALEPDFPSVEVDRVREQQLAEIRQRSMDPSALASDEVSRRFYAEGLPYARPQVGTEFSINSVTRDQIRGYAEACYRPGSGGLIIVGDVDPEQIRSLSGEYFGSWIGSPSAVDNFRVDAQTRERRVWILDRPGSVQSEIRVGHVGVARTTPNYLPLSIGNLLLGGTFTSRLNLNLRERNGFTYGVRSRFSFRSQPGPFQVSTAVGNEVTASAVREILSELESLVVDGVTREEVDAARDYAAGVFGLHLETAGQIASRLNQILVYGLPDDYYHLYRDNIRSVSTEEVTSAVKAHIRPDEVQVIIVGDAESILGSVDALGLGPLEVV